MRDKWIPKLGDDVTCGDELGVITSMANTANGVMCEVNFTNGSTRRIHVSHLRSFHAPLSAPDSTVELKKPYPATYSCSGGGASMTNFVFEMSWRAERVVVYLCLTVISICWIVSR